MTVLGALILAADSLGGKVIPALAGAATGGTIGVASTFWFDKRKAKREKDERQQEGRTAADDWCKRLRDVRETLEAIQDTWVPSQQVATERASTVLLRYLDDPALQALDDAEAALRSVQIRITLNERDDEHPPNTPGGTRVISAAVGSLARAETELTRLVGST